MLTIDTCRHCRDAFSPADEDDDLCYLCQTSPVMGESEAMACLNCGWHFQSDDGVGQFCSADCAARGYAEIVGYRRAS
jgi:hypothetical protein